MEVDGHFWVVDNENNIYDEAGFWEYRVIKEEEDLEGDCVYYEAPMLVQKVMIKMWIPEAERAIDVYNWFWCQFGFCNRNAVLMKRSLEKGNPEKTYRIVFGSMGWKKRSDGVYWMFGNDEWTKVCQFLRK